MIATTTHIETPPHFKPHDDWSSHRPALWLALENNKNKLRFFELGSGHGSTKLIRDWCKSDGVEFHSFDNDKDWCKTTGAMYIEDYKTLDVPNNAILFIDGKPGSDRKGLIKQNRNKSVIIAHDTEEGANYVYGMADILSTFKYRLDFKPEGMPQTTIVSDFINVAKWI